MLSTAYAVRPTAARRRVTWLGWTPIRRAEGARTKPSFQTPTPERSVG